jgi:hypothetical protein
MIRTYFKVLSEKIQEKTKELRNSADVMSQNSLCPDRNCNLVFN